MKNGNKKIRITSANSLLAVLICLGLIMSGCSGKLSFYKSNEAYDNNYGAIYSPSGMMKEAGQDYYDNYHDDLQENVLIENPVINTSEENTSTFSIDVDNASYVNFRNYMKQMSIEEFQSNNYTIRTEEALNYFTYDYTKPTGDKPIAVTTTVGECTWNSESKIAMITVAGKEIDAARQEGSNIVFLIDVSGSMDSEYKLPLLKTSLAKAIENLNVKDTVSIVTYASGVHTLLAGAKGTEKGKIIDALNKLTAGGSTAGASGLERAYSVAENFYIENGNNRIIIASDGDFNVGPSSAEDIKKLVTEKRDSGIFTTVLGFGVSYNAGDGKLEALADNGNGGYYVIDCEDEAEKILNKQFTGSLYTIAKDVKIQVEFNASAVESYRLIGYENRVLANEDFENDSVDAGDMGAGQTVTALYEIVLKPDMNEKLFTVSVRYKEPNADQSQLYTHDAQINTDINDDYRFACAVAEACLVINKSKYKGTATLAHAAKAAKDYAGGDKYKLQFAELIKN